MSRLSDELRRPWVPRVAQVLLAIVPIVTAAARAVRDGWFPIGDSALLYIRAADVGTSHHPFLGSWTSASLSVGRNMNNPGAMYDWFIAPFAHLFSPGVGAAVGVASVNVLAIVGISIAAHHVGGRSFERWMVLAAAALAWSMGSELLIDIWQAHALLLPFLLFLVLLTGFAVGKHHCLPWALGVASLLVQTHISYAYVLACLAVTTTVLRWLQHRERGWRERLDLVHRRTVAWSVGVVAVLWLPSLWEQFFGEGEGNLSRLVRSAGGGDATLGAANATKGVAAVFMWPVWWLRGGFSGTIPSTPVVDTPSGRTVTIAGLPPLALSVLLVTALVAGLVVLGIAAGRRGLELQRIACWLAAALVASAVFCLSALTIGPGGLAAHHVRWIWTAAVFTHFVAFFTVASLVVLRRPQWSSWIDWGIVVLLAVFTVANLPFEAHPEGPVADRAVNPVLEQVFRKLSPLAAYAPVRYDTSNLRVYEPYSSAVMMAMQDQGIEFRVSDEGMVRQLGEGRRASGDEQVVVFQLEGLDAIDYAGPACRLALASQITGDAAEAARVIAGDAEEALVNGDVTVLDGQELAPDDAALFDAVAQGDQAAIRRVVYGGVLSRLVADGKVEQAGRDPQEWFAELLTVDRWAATTYGLFATLPEPCPAE